MTAEDRRRDVQANARDVAAAEREIKVDKTESHIVHSTERLQSGLRLLIWMCCILAVLLIGSLAGSYVMQRQLNTLDNNVDQVEKASNATTVAATGAKQSADDALKELREAILAVQESNEDEPALNNQEIIDALRAISRLELYICGGPCPEGG